MVVDYEAVVVALQAHVASKSQHGREGLLREIAELLERHRVPAGELSRLLRLYGVEVERARSIATELERSERPDFAGGDVSLGDELLAAHDRPEGGHHVGNGNGARRSGS